LRQTQEQLVIQGKLASLGALTAGIAHEIKNPLNFVTNFATLAADLARELREELIAQRHKLDATSMTLIEELLVDIEQNVTKIHEHGKRADSIVTGMLQHSRGKPGEWQPTDLNRLLQEYIGLAYHGLRAQDASCTIHLETRFDPAIGRIMPAVHSSGIESTAFLLMEYRQCKRLFPPTASVHPVPSQSFYRP
jgi:C4-dicarboxylate-specific signal transduction histidine kinase